MLVERLSLRGELVEEQAHLIDLEQNRIHGLAPVGR